MANPGMIYQVHHDEAHGTPTPAVPAAETPGAENTIAGTAAAEQPMTEAKPKALGMDATMWVALAMLLVIGLAVWKKVPAMVGAALDKQIGAIQAQLDKATKLREEAEAIKAEYLANAKQAEKDAAAIRAGAEDEAKLIVKKAKEDASELIHRRKEMAEQKIAAAEAEAIADVRAKAAATAAAAAELLIAENADPKSDASLIDKTIASLN